jgi:AcrR family transcriptional regulator
MSRPIQKKEQIVEAAMKLFVEKGVEATTTREIAELAKTGEGTMFRHYKSKEALAWEIFDENLSLLIRNFEETTSHLTTTRDKIHAMVEKCYVLYETDRVRCAYLLLVEHTAAHNMGPDYRTPIKVLDEVIQAGQAKGEVKEMDHALATALVIGAILRIPLFKYYGQIQNDLREFIEPVTEAVWSMIGVPAGSSQAVVRSSSL